MTDSTIVIAVDGQDGDDFARTRLQESDDSRALVRYGHQEDRNGEHGQDARMPLDGRPGGLLAVELVQSQEHRGYIHAFTRRWEGEKQPALSTEIPPRHKIRLSAAGGKGETGLHGGDGQDGLPGIKGRDATARSDAENGTEGGVGGNAGRGSHGGNGGNGGAVQILLGAYDTHLLFAIECDVTGGDGGRAGKHGKFGKGGAGGYGGLAIEWDQFVGYKYYCTPNCQTGASASNSTISRSSSQSLVRIGSSLARTSTQLRAAMGSELVRGGNLQAAVAAIAARYHTRLHEQIDHGLCRCAGGGNNSNCLGCRSERITKTLRRDAGEPGPPGNDGTPQTSLLNAGVPGDKGEVTIMVRNLDGTISEYSEPWKLRLVSFDIEDENGDGIFEPGENVVVRRICIENFGGMPSPLQGIELMIKPSDHFIPDHTRKLFIPSSIARHSSVTLEGYVCARIAQPDITPLGKPYIKQGIKISLDAIVPWLEWKLPDFDIERSFDIQFPCSLANVDILASISPGSSTNIEWQVQNSGNQALGIVASPMREVKVVISIPSRLGTLDSRYTIANGDAVEVPIVADNIEPKATISSSQSLTILPETRAPAQIDVMLTLYIYNAAHGSSETSGPMHVAAHRVQCSARISESYQYNSSAEFLLVVNSKTTPQRIKALQAFIRADLGMVADCWDVNLNGGLQTQEGDASGHLFSKYPGKTIILLGEQFPFLDSSQRSISKLCDSRQMRQALALGTSFLALGLKDDPPTKDLIRRTVFDVQDTHRNVLSSTPDSRRFTSLAVLASAIASQKRNGNNSSTEFVLAGRERRWYDVLNPTLERQSKSASLKLRKLLPQTRFLISPVERATDQKSSSSRDMVVLLGADRNIPLQATEYNKRTSNSLDKLEKFNIVAALPATQRTEQLWSETAYEDGGTSFVTECAICSLAIDCINEINSYAFSVYSAGSIKTGLYQDADLFRIHLSTIATLIHRLGPSIPSPAIQVLAYCLAACRAQSKRQFVAEKLINASCRRKLGVHLDALIEKRIGEHGKQAMGTIHKKVDEFHPRNISTLNVILERASVLTEVSKHAFVHSRSCSLSAAPDSVTYESLEWDAHYEANEKTWAQITECEHQATQKLRRRLTVRRRHELST